MQRSEAALADYETTIRLDPDSAEVFFLTEDKYVSPWSGNKHKTQWEILLEGMKELIPKAQLEVRSHACFRQAGLGRELLKYSALLRIHDVPLCYNLSDSGKRGLP